MSDSSRFVVPFQSPLWNQQPVPLSELNFWQSGDVGVTRQNTYSDAALTILNTNPVVADGNGQFGNIFLIDGAAYGVVYTTSSVFPNVPVDIWTADPVAAQLPAAFVGDSGTGGTAGIVPAPPANSAAEGYVLLANGLWGIPLVVPPASSIAANQPGYIGAPLNVLTANYALQLSDLGKGIVSNTGTPLTITIPSDVSAGWPPSMASVILLSVPYGNGAWTISPAAGVTLLSPPSFTTSASRTFTWGAAALERWGTNLWFLVGTNIS